MNNEMIKDSMFVKAEVAANEKEHAKLWFKLLCGGSTGLQHDRRCMGKTSKE